MNQERLLKVLLAPIVSEKSARLGDAHRQFVFKVMTDAAKPEIKAAVESLFDVKVEKVSVSKMKGKSKRFGRFFGKRPDWKKAYVTLQEGFDIEFGAAE